jgi:formamidopyrimidine-DNA glycosylase
MPELPEVETMCRRIASVVGSKILDITRPKTRLRPIIVNPSIPILRRRVIGKKIAAVNRIGKRVVLVLEDDNRIVIEPRMTGIVMLNNAPNQKHIRLIFELSNQKADTLLFWDQRGLGVVNLFTPQQLADALGSEKIGPDALETTPEILRERLGNSRREIKVALLDQHAISGIGNLYASEILHRAYIHPATPCYKLKPRHWSAIHAATIVILTEAILHQGSTLRDGTYRASHDQPGSYQDKHRVYQRAGKLCQQCRKSEILRIVQAQRSTFYCPTCQRKPKYLLNKGD